MGSIERHLNRSEKKGVAHPWLKRHDVIFSTIGSVALALLTAAISVSSCQQQSNADATMASLSENSNQLAEIANSISTQQTELMRMQNELAKTEQEPLLTIDAHELLDDGTTLYRFTSFGGNPVAPQITLYDTFTYYVYHQSNDEEPLPKNNMICSAVLNVFGRYSTDAQLVQEPGVLLLSSKECAQPTFDEYSGTFYRNIQSELASKGYRVAYSQCRTVSYSYQSNTQGYSIYALIENQNGDFQLVDDRYMSQPDKSKLTLSVQYSSHKNEFDKSPEDLSKEYLAQLNMV